MIADDQIAVATDLFEHREVKPHFINPCCFGEDFAAWLRDAISSLAAEGFSLSEPIQEDYGWGFWAKRGKDTFWIALGICDDSPKDGPAEWIVFVSYDPGLNVIKRLFHRPDMQAFSQLRDRVWEAIRSNPGMRELPEH